MSKIVRMKSWFDVTDQAMHLRVLCGDVWGGVGGIGPIDSLSEEQRRRRAKILEIEARYSHNLYKILGVEKKDQNYWFFEDPRSGVKVETSLYMR